MTISLPAKFRYDCTDTAGALLAQQYCIERFAKLKGKAPKRMEFVERFLGVQFSGRTAGLYPVLALDWRKVGGSNPSAPTIFKEIAMYEFYNHFDHKWFKVPYFGYLTAKKAGFLVRRVYACQ